MQIFIKKEMSRNICNAIPEGNTLQDSWHAAFPQPQSAVQMVSAGDLHSLLEDARFS